MKFGITGRDITDKNKFMSNKPKGDFLDRFKGRTIQMNKEGHLGVVKNTKMPIKAVHDQPMQSYNNSNQPEHHSALLKRPNMGSELDVRKKNNFEALSPFAKRSSSIDGETFSSRNDRYNSFARNYQKMDNALTKSYNSPGLRKGLSNAGGEVMKPQHSNSVKREVIKVGSSHSMGPEHKLNGSFTTPSKPNDLSNPYGSLKMPLAMQANVLGKNMVSKFMPTQAPNTQKYGSKESLNMPYKNGSFAGGNSDGFLNTAVSTPLYH